MGSEIGGLLSGFGGLVQLVQLHNPLGKSVPSNGLPSESTTFPINAGPTFISMVLKLLQQDFLVQYH